MFRPVSFGLRSPNMISLLVAPFVALFAGADALSQDSATRAGRVVLDRAAVERWMDARVGPALEASGIPGAIVVVVQRSAVGLTKGYGISELATGAKVDPERPLFNLASI